MSQSRLNTLMARGHDDRVLNRHSFYINDQITLDASGEINPNKAVQLMLYLNLATVLINVVLVLSALANVSDKVGFAPSYFTFFIPPLVYNIVASSLMAYLLTKRYKLSLYLMMALLLIQIFANFINQLFAVTAICQLVYLLAAKFPTVFYSKISKRTHHG